MFQTVLIANRGEIACRVIDTLRRLGIRSVAVYSDADADARHVKMADVAVRLGVANAADSYLNIDKIIAAALQTGAEAIHPGYGFLSENAGFAEACKAASVVFIGPGVAALEVMGDKISAKAQVEKRNVPTVPGISRPGLTDEELEVGAQTVGFPVLIKPSAGGGGKGMHLVHESRELAPALAAARREAAASFGDDTLFIERFIQNPRHIEVQVLADSAGHIVHLGERECSLQRRHQKVIEEAPSALLDEITRARIGQAAIDTAKSCGYVGAGTVEFIVSADAPEEFFFMEMNTRLQVEHPVTEMITGVDLVEWQLRVAAGEELDFTQSDVTLTGHAIEARIFAEDPERGFLPTGGTILALHQPSGEGIRVDSALLEGLTVSSDYDPMLAKVIAWGPDRPSAIRRLQAALAGMVTLGVSTNVEFLKLLLADGDVVAGDLDTELIERHLDGYEFHSASPEHFAAAALILDGQPSRRPGPWTSRDGWRLTTPAPSRYQLRVGDVSTNIEVSASSNCVAVDSNAPVTASIEMTGSRARVRCGDATHRYVFAVDGHRVHLGLDGIAWSFEELGFELFVADEAAGHPELRSPMPGAVVAVFVDDGADVEAGAPMLSIEAMKMEHVLRAPIAGRVEMSVAVGAQVKADQVVAAITDTATDADKELS